MKFLLDEHIDPVLSKLLHEVRKMDSEDMENTVLYV